MSVVARPSTLVDAVLPRADALQNLLVVFAASLLTAVAAQVAIRLPWTPVPVTGQTFAVLLAGVVLGPRRAFLAQALYLLEGAAGLPVFAGGAAGVLPLVGPTGGYLLSFPFAALVTGVLARRTWDRRPFTMFLAMLLGSTVIFAFGLAWLSVFVPGRSLLVAGLAPFVPGDLAKAALAAAMLPAAWKFAGGRGDAR